MKLELNISFLCIQKYFPLTLRILYMVTDSDANIVRAALGAVILVRITKANTKTVTGELNPGPGQGDNSTPWYGRVLV